LRKRRKIDPAGSKARRFWQEALSVASAAVSFAPVSRASLPLLAIACLALAIGFAESGVAAAPGCGSFASQAEAQERLLALGGSPSEPIPRLDPDRDGVACEGSPGPYKGYATVAYSSRQGFFHGTAAMPPESGGAGFACLEGNRHFDDGPRLLTLLEARPGPDLVVRAEVPTATRPSSGRVLWKLEKAPIASGRYYVIFEERQPLTPYGPNQCPGFRSAEFSLPRPVR
jgi:hypothetical protein